jgi:hypothetical protein
MHKQSFDSHRVSVENVSLLIRAYVHAAHEYFKILYLTPGILEIDLSVSDGFDL